MAEQADAAAQRRSRAARRCARRSGPRPTTGPAASRQSRAAWTCRRRWPEQRDELAGVAAERHVVERAPAAEVAGDVGEAQRREVRRRASLRRRFLVQLGVDALERRHELAPARGVARPDRSCRSRVLLLEGGAAPRRADRVGLEPPPPLDVRGGRRAGPHAGPHAARENDERQRERDVARPERRVRQPAERQRDVSPAFSAGPWPTMKVCPSAASRAARRSAATQLQCRRPSARSR